MFIISKVKRWQKMPLALFYWQDIQSIEENTTEMNPLLVQASVAQNTKIFYFTGS